MRSICKKLAIIAATLIFGLPGMALAQDNAENGEASQTPDNAEKNEEVTDTNGTPENTPSEQAPSEHQVTPQNPPAAQQDMDESKLQSAPAVSVTDAIASQKSSREAKKEAMRSLSSNYPANASPNNPDTAAAQTKPETITPRIIGAAPKTTERMPHFEHHGYFRTRLNVFGNYDLNTRGTSPVPASLESSQRGNTSQENISVEDSDTHIGGNLRFRYEPTIHISESVRVSGVFDIMDNLVMGTSPNGLVKNWGSHEFFSFNGATPVNGDTIGKNAISVKALYGEADTFLGTFRAGRIPAHWGLGIVYNDGGVYKREEQQLQGHGWQCLDCDSNDAVDRVEWRIRDPFFDTLYFDFSWDFINSGLASYQSQQDSYGQAFDLSEADDVIQFTISIFDRPLSQQEVDQRYRNLFELRQWTADWGILFSYREQEIAPETNAQKSNDGASATYDMYEKNAQAYVIDAWGRFLIPCPKDVMLRLEAEFVGVFGSVDLDTGAEGKSRDITQIGFALEAETQWRDLNVGLKTGVAWADNMTYSGHSIIESLDEVPMGSILRFDPNYTVDTIMFKQLMDGINNAWYLNLYGEYKFPLQMSQITMSLGARVDLTTSGPIVKNATPGNDSWYGFEGNLKLFYDESDRFRFEIGAGIFVPGNAWENVDYPVLPSQSVYEKSTSETYDPDIAWNVLANLIFMF